MLFSDWLTRRPVFFRRDLFSLASRWTVKSRPISTPHFVSASDVFRRFFSIFKKTFQTPRIWIVVGHNWHRFFFEPFKFGFLFGIAAIVVINAGGNVFHQTFQIFWPIEKSLNTGQKNECCYFLCFILAAAAVIDVIGVVDDVGDAFVTFRNKVNLFISFYVKTVPFIHHLVPAFLTF